MEKDINFIKSLFAALKTNTINLTDGSVIDQEASMFHDEYDVATALELSKKGGIIIHWRNNKDNAESFSTLEDYSEMLPDILESIENSLSAQKSAMDIMKRLMCGDCHQENEDIVIASGEETKEYGFLHTWYIDAPSASFSGTKAGVRWEIIAVDKISEIITIDSDDYEDGKDDEEYKEMEKFIKALEDSVCDGELIFNPENELESYSRIW